MDDVAKRREARRRKILENSENRLNRISGIEKKSTRTCIEETCTKSSIELPSGLHSVSNETEDDAQPQQTRVEELPPPQKSQKQYRTTVISALAIFINLFLFVVEKLKFDSDSSNINKIFLPLFVYEVIEFLSLNQHRTGHNNFLFALVALSYKNKYIPSVIHYLVLITDVLQDAMVYFFVFVCCEYVKNLVCILS